MKEKTARYLHRFASVFVSVALVSMFAFPLAAIADPEETVAPATEETATTEAAAEETAPAEDGITAAEDVADPAAEAADASTEATTAGVGGELTATPVTGAAGGYSALGVPYTGGLDVDITTFAIDNGLTGHLTAGRPGAAPSLSGTGAIGEASYYVTAPDGTVLTFAYWHNGFETSPFYLVIDDGTSLWYLDVAALRIASVSTEEVTPGYTAVTFESFPTDMSSSSTPWFGLIITVAVTMTPSPDGTVYYDWQFISDEANDFEPMLGGVYALDTMLNVADDVSVYSLGTNQGMYLADASAFATVTLPWVTSDGPDDMAAVRYKDDAWDNIEKTFDPDLSKNVSYDIPSNPGDLLFASGDSAVYYRYGFQTLERGTNRSMRYAVGLNLNPAALPATGDTSPTVVIAGLAVLAVGATLVTLAVRRRSRRHSVQ